MLTGFKAQQIRPSDPHRTPTSRGTTSRKVSFYPFCRQMVAFQHFSSPFGALTRTTKASDGVEDVRGHLQTHTQSLYGHRKGCKSCQRASVEV
ncbi:hypothetical protein TNIN_342351 [Trichonephila inaurata madagascariensis]|uniref:Uncharacterized protein n=1 Tax=Trichonephila inaurata madagascariensis TaxID=2747483 RepID=A0A8X6WQE8_9ARAC|nr:hypothetical protein TNIN_342351 [Trichonephila inaurata madagascariensis]